MRSPVTMARDFERFQFKFETSFLEKKNFFENFRFPEHRFPVENTATERTTSPYKTGLSKANFKTNCGENKMDTY